jgi:iron-sulfur cluster repair protein YtfE (RIC family)
MDIYQLLKKDHKEAKDLFKKIQSGDGEKEAFFSKLRQELLVHMEGEEKLFYPVLKKNEETREKIEEGLEEHGEAKKIIKEIQSMRGGGDGQWDEKLDELKEAIEHHVKEEEEELFPLAKHVLSKEQVAQMAEQFQQIKQQKLAKQT